MVVWSTLVHAGALGLVVASPSMRHREPPRVIAVELNAPAPAAPVAKPAPAPAPPEAAPPPPKAEPAPPPPPPPPEPKAIVLPEKQTAPKPKDKPKEKPKPTSQKEVFKEPPKKQEKSLDDLLAEMRGSEAKPAPAPAPAQAPAETATATVGAPSEGTVELSPEEAAWRARVIRKMKGLWVVGPGFRTQPLETRVVVTLDAAGNIIGEPRITKKSGNPWYDEGVIRGLAKSSPLPPPPDAGEREMWFRPEDSL